MSSGDVPMGPVYHKLIKKLSNNKNHKKPSITFPWHSFGVMLASHKKCGINELSQFWLDGLLKIWNVETSESVGSFDAHDDKIWSVESLMQKIVTGARDGQIILWKNVTEQVENSSQALNTKVFKRRLDTSASCSK